MQPAGRRRANAAVGEPFPWPDREVPEEFRHRHDPAQPGRPDVGGRIQDAAHELVDAPDTLAAYEPPDQRSACDQLDLGPRLQNQRRALDGALSRADDDDGSPREL